ncbi:MAG TPA: hypothetical protein VGL34_03820 [Steroidobacteraceae bacterium]|jgi:hypothetical protein
MTSPKARFRSAGGFVNRPRSRGHRADRTAAQRLPLDYNGMHGQLSLYRRWKSKRQLMADAFDSRRISAWNQARRDSIRHHSELLMDMLTAPLYFRTLFGQVKLVGIDYRNDD